MGDLLLAIGVLIYFGYSSEVRDMWFFISLSLNFYLIIAQLLIFIPTIISIFRSYARNNLTSIWDRMHKYRLKSIAMSSFRIPFFCFLVLTLSVLSVYTLIASVFQWKNFEYLFVVVCLIGCTVSDACLYVRIKCDFSSAYAIETFKFFMLILTTIFFGISGS